MNARFSILIDPTIKSFFNITQPCLLSKLKYSLSLEEVCKGSGTARSFHLLTQQPEKTAHQRAQGQALIVPADTSFVYRDICLEITVKHPKFSPWGPIFRSCFHQVCAQFFS